MSLSLPFPPCLAQCLTLTSEYSRSVLGLALEKLGSVYSALSEPSVPVSWSQTTLLGRRAWRKRDHKEEERGPQMRCHYWMKPSQVLEPTETSLAKHQKEHTSAVLLSPAHIVELRAQCGAGFKPQCLEVICYTAVGRRNIRQKSEKSLSVWTSFIYENYR